MYFGTFFEQMKRNIWSVAFWCFYFIWQVIIEMEFFLPAYANVLISIILVSIICISTYKGRVLQKVVFSVLINTIWMLAEFLVGYMFTLCGIHYMIPKFWGSLLSKMLIMILIIVLKNFFQNENIKSLSNKYNMILLLIPTGSMFVVYNIFMLSIEINNKQSIRKSLTSSMIILVINIIMFKLYLNLSKEKELQKYNTVYEQQLELCDQHMREKENVMKEFRNARHDMKQHFIVLMEMLDTDKTKDAIDYLSKLINMEALSNPGVSKTNNIVVDSLINAKNTVALKANIEFEINIHIPMELPFKNADMSILLGNILDNAIEASEQLETNKRFIKFYMQFNNNVLIITVMNAFNGNLNRSRDGKIISNKDNPDNHGIGLESVNKIAEKYHGSVVIETRNDIFIIKVVLLCELP